MNSLMKSCYVLYYFFHFPANITERYEGQKAKENSSGSMWLKTCNKGQVFQQLIAVAKYHWRELEKSYLRMRIEAFIEPSVASFPLTLLIDFVPQIRILETKNLNSMTINHVRKFRKQVVKEKTIKIQKKLEILRKCSVWVGSLVTEKVQVKGRF